MDEYLSAPTRGDAALHNNDMGVSEQVRLDAALDEALCCIREALPSPWTLP